MKFGNVEKEIIIFGLFKFAAALLGVLFLKLYTTLFTVEEVGVFNLALNLFTLIITISISWIGLASLRLTDDYKDFYDSFISTLILTVLSIGSLIIIISLVVFNFASVIEDEIFFAFLALIIPFSFYEVFINVLRAQGKIIKFNVSTLLLSLLKVIFLLVMYYIWDLKIMSLYYCLLITYILVDIYILSNLNISNKIKNLTIKKELLKEIYFFGSPLILLSSIAWITSYSDRYIISIFDTEYEVGIYSTIYDLAFKTFFMATSIIITVAYPIIVRKWNSGGNKEALKTIEIYLKYYNLLAIPALLTIYILSDRLIMLFTSEKYIVGSDILIIICLGIYFQGITNYYNKPFELKKQTKKLLLIYGYVAIINLVLNIILIPLFGYEAAAYSTLFSYIIGWVLVIMKEKEIKIKIYYKETNKVILLSFLISIPLYLLSKELSYSLRNTVLIIIVDVILFLVMYLILYRSNLNK